MAGTWAPPRLQFPYRPFTLTVPLVQVVEDPSTPSVALSTGTGVLTTAPFSPPANSLLLAIVGGGWGDTVTATVSDTGSHTWIPGIAANGLAALGGLVSTLTTYLPTAPGSITVSAGYNAALQGGRLLAVRVLNGANPDQTGGARLAHATVSSTDATVTPTTTVVGSLVYGAGNNPGSASVWTPNAATTTVTQYNDATDAVTLVAWVANLVTTTPGPIALGGTYGVSTSGNNIAFEVLPVLMPAAPDTASLYQTSQYGSFF